MTSIGPSSGRASGTKFTGSVRPSHPRHSRSSLTLPDTLGGQNSDRPHPHSANPTSPISRHPVFTLRPNGVPDSDCHRAFDEPISGHCKRLIAYPLIKFTAENPFRSCPGFPGGGVRAAQELSGSVKSGQDHHPHGLKDVTPVEKFFTDALGTKSPRSAHIVFQSQPG